MMKTLLSNSTSLREQSRLGKQRLWRLEYVCLKSKLLILVLGLIFAALQRQWSLYIRLIYSPIGQEATGSKSIIKSRLSVP